HEQGIVHGDFKPDNVVVGDDGRVRVLDFGLARVPAEAPRDAIAGTPAYMAPEQHEGRAVDARADQFAFAVALYEAAHGARPFHGTSAKELADEARAGHIASATRGRVVPSWLRQALLRALSADPETRFPSMRALLDVLRRDRPRRSFLIPIAA